MKNHARRRDDPDYTRLFHAYAKGFAVLASVTRAANINAEARDGRTILYDACVRNDVEVVRHLVALGAEVNHRDDDGLTPLHMATIHSALESAAELLDAGAQVDVRDGDGNTPLSNAVYNSEGRGELIRLLLDSGADPDIVNNHGVSPRSLAENIGNYDVKQFLR